MMKKTTRKRVIAFFMSIMMMLSMVTNVGYAPIAEEYETSGIENEGGDIFADATLTDAINDEVNDEVIDNQASEEYSEVEVEEDIQWADPTPRPIASYFNTVTVFTDYNWATGTGTAYDPTKTYPDDTVFTFRLEFVESNITGHINQFNGYEEYVYQLPSTLDVIAHTEDIYDESDPERPKVGYFTTDPATKQIHVHLDDSYNTKYTNGRCWLTFDSRLNLTEDQTETEIKLPTGGEDYIIPIKIDAEPGLSASKVATYNATTHTAHYTVTVRVRNGDMTNVTVQDVMGENANLSYSGPISYVVKDKNGNSKGNGTIPAANGSFTNNFGSMAKGDVVTIEYDAKLDQNAQMDNNLLDTTNDVHSTGDYTFNGQPQTATADAKYNLKDHNDLKYDLISKSNGTVNPDGTVDWTVTVNGSNQYPISGQFTDTLSDPHLSFPDSLTDMISYTKYDSNGSPAGSGHFTPSLSADGKTISLDFNDASAFKYVMTYKTKYTVNTTDVGSIPAKNVAKFKNPNYEEEDDGTAPLPGIETNIHKSYTTYSDNINHTPGTGYVDWKYVIDVPAEGLNNVYVEDYFPNTYYNGGFKYPTLDTASVTVTSDGPAVVKGSVIEKNGQNGNLYDNGNSGFTLYFGSGATQVADSKLPANPNGIGYHVTVTYRMYLAEGMGSKEDNPNNQPWIGNTVNLHVFDATIPSDSTVEIKPPAQIQKTATKTEAGGYVVFTVQLDYGQVGLGNAPVILEDIFDTSKFDYVPGSVTIQKSKNRYFNEALPVTNTPSVNNTQTGAEFNFGVLNETYLDSDSQSQKPYTYYVTYKLKIHDDILNTQQGIIQVDNKANLYIGDPSEFVSTSSAHGDYENNVILKKLEKVPGENGYEGKNVEFSIEINPSKSDLFPDTDEITISDYMCEGLSLDVTDISIKSYEYVNDNGWQHYDWVKVPASDYSVIYDDTFVDEEGNKVVKFVLPKGDKKHLFITYGTKLNGLLGTQVTIKNKANITGTNLWSKSPDKTVTITNANSGSGNQNAGAGGSKTSFEVDKFDASLATKFLPGAEFDLYAVEIDWADASHTGVSLTLGSKLNVDPYKTSNVNDATYGKAVINYNNFQDYAVYVLRESKAPVGYDLGEINKKPLANAVNGDIYDTDLLFIYQGGGTQPVPDYLKEMLIASGIKTISAGSAVSRSNNRKSVVVFATKDLIGKSLGEYSGQFKYILEECDAQGNIIPDGQKANGSNDSNGKVEFEALTYENLDFTGSHENDVYTFYYQMSEVNTGVDKITYDTNKYLLKVDVSYDSTKGEVVTKVNGELCNTDYQSGKTFVNYYTGSASGKISIPGTKTLNGADISDTATNPQHIFTFDIQEITSATNVTPKASGYSSSTTNNNSSFEFKDIPFATSTLLPGQSEKHYFLISERAGQVKGYTYASTKYVAEVTVTAPSDGGPNLDVQLTKVWTYTTNVADATEVTNKQIKFENKYTKYLEIPVQKMWVDGAGTDRPASIKVMLLATRSDGCNCSLTEYEGTNGYSEIVALTPSNNWYYKFTDKPEYDKAGHKINYEVFEQGRQKVGNSYYIASIQYANGDYKYKTETTGSLETGFTITNTLMTSISGKKIWNDGLSHDTDTVEVTLMKDGVATTQTATLTASNSWEYSFKNLQAYKLDGTKIAYTVKETEVNGAANNKYIVSYEPNSTNGYDIRNTNPETSFSLKAEKEYIYGTLYNDEFKFTLYNSTNNGTTITWGNVVETKTNGAPSVADGAPSSKHFVAPVDFSSITVTEPGTYYYKIVESGLGTSSKDASDVLFDNQAYVAVVEVTRLEDNSLANTVHYYKLKNNNATNVIATDIDTAGVLVPTFSNRDNQTTDLILTGSKSVVDSQNNPVTMNKVFTFNLYDDAYMTSPTLYKNNNAGNFSFQTITFDSTLVGQTKTYYVTESQGAAPDGFTYDGSVYRIDIEVYQDDADNNKLKAHTYYTKYSGGTQDDNKAAAQADKDKSYETLTSGARTGSVVATKDVSGIVFTNEYNASGEATVQLNKTVVGINTQGTYQFTVEKNAGAGGTITTSPVSITTVEDALDPKSEGEGTFTISYGLADAGKTHYYTIKETKESISGITYDNTYYLLEVNVVDNKNGTLTPSYKVYKNGDTTAPTALVATSNDGAVVSGISFMNTYTAPGSVTVALKKQIDAVDANDNVIGTKAVVNEQFEFELTGTSDNVPADSVTTQTKKNDGSGIITFDTFTYTLADVGKTYTYTIEEKGAAAAGYTNDPAHYEVEVYVGTQPSANGGYEVKPVVSYYRVLNGYRKLLADPTTEAVFHNTYKASTTVDFAATKIYQDVDNVAKPLQEGAFTFTLADATGQTIETKKNAADGSVTFTTLSYDYKDFLNQGAAGYTYTISEVGNANDKNTKYSTDVYNIKVVLSDAGNGTLGKTVTITKNADPTLLGGNADVKFTNILLDDGKISLSGKKTVANKTYVDENQFSFQLIDDSTNTVLQTVKNKSDGTFGFEDIVIKPNISDGTTFDFTVKEVQETKAGYTYDTNIYKIHVLANVDAGTGKLTLTTTIKHVDKDGTDVAAGVANTALDFTNTYTASGSVDLGAQKTLVGSSTPLKTGDFEFKLYKGTPSGTSYTFTEVETKSNVGPLVAFSTINYTQADIGKSYLYKIEEVIPAPPVANMEYDTDLYYALVEIGDNGDGTLDITTGYYKNLDLTTSPIVYPEGKKVQLPGFLNTVITNGKFILTGTKEMTGAVMEANQFIFEMTGPSPRDKYGDSHNETYIAKNKANGDIVFPALEYSRMDINHQYVYTVVEKNDGQLGVTYDTTVYTVTVQVSLVNNTVVASPTITVAGNEQLEMKFKNKYSADGNAKINGLKYVNDIVAKESFDFALYGDATCTDLIDTTSNSAVDGSFSFARHYDLADLEGQPSKEFTYYVKEVIPDPVPAGSVYDESVHKVVITVTNTGSGTLETSVKYPAEFTDGKLEFKNTYTDKLIKLTIKKLNQRDELIGGAELTIYEYADYDANGNLATPVETFVTVEDQEYYVTDKLELGREYILVEQKAPAGYKIADPIRFKVTNFATISTYAIGGMYIPDPTATIKMVDQTELLVEKVDQNGDIVSGATLVIMDSNETTTYETITTTNNKHKVLYNIQPETEYVLKEITTPRGYETAPSIVFKKDAIGNLYVKVDGVFALQKVAILSMVDEKQYVSIKKTDLVDGRLVEGAKLSVSDSNGVEKFSWTTVTTEPEHKIALIDLVVNEVYTLTEVTAPFGYEVAESIQFYVDANNKVYVKGADDADFTLSTDKLVKMQDEPKYLSISKVDIANGVELPGAELTIKKVSDGTVIDTWTSTANKHEIETYKFAPNTEYTLTEVTSPFGYDIAETITFKFDENGKVSVKNEDGTYDVTTDDIVVMEDDHAYIHVSKKDITNGEELPGATLIIKDKDGKEVEKWVSTTEAHDIEVLKFKANEEYTFTEITAPFGYDVAETITFKFDESGKLYVKNSEGTFVSVASDILTMEDAYSSINISKVDATNGKELPGATLIVTDKNGKQIDKWVSTTDTHKITVNSFIPDDEYTLTEITSPFGFEVAESIIFKIGKDGKISVKNSDGEFELVTTDTVVMEDKPIYINVSKTDITNGKELPGATLVIGDKDGNQIDKWVSTEEVHKVRQDLFKPNVEYIFTEITAPFGYDIAEVITFKFDENGKIYVKNSDGTFTLVTDGSLVMQDSYTSISISKVNLTNGEELPGATLIIQDKNGKEIDKWVSTTEAHKITVKTFTPGEEYTLTEITAPQGFDVAESITFKFDEQGKIYVKNSDGSFTELTSSTIVMFDQPSITTTTTTTSSAKTGDKSPIVLIMISMIASAIGMFFMIRRRREV